MIYGFEYISIDQRKNCLISVAGTTSLLLLLGRLLLSHVVIPQLMTDNRIGAVNEESNITNQGNSDGDKVLLFLSHKTV